MNTEFRNPRLKVRTTWKVGGTPGELLAAAEGGRVFVFDAEQPCMAVAGPGSAFESRKFNVPPPAPGSRWFLGGFGEGLLAVRPDGQVALFDRNTLGLRGGLEGSGQACDFRAFPDGGGGILVTAEAVELLEPSPFRSLDRVALKRPPVAGTLATLPQHAMGAVATRDPGGLGDVVALFATRPLEALFEIPVPGGVRSLAFEKGGEFLYAACFEGNNVAVVDLALRRVVDLLHMPGRPCFLMTDATTRRVWAACERVGHVAVIDVWKQETVKRIFAPGLDGSANRPACSLDDRLVAIPESGNPCISLVDSGAMGGDEGLLYDRLDLGVEPGAVVWSPLGDELYVAIPSQGRVISIAVDRGDLPIVDTDQYLLESLRRQQSAAGHKHPLFPP